jgi:predicted aldo/keto reductase-like oxidoreductase
VVSNSELENIRKKVGIGIDKAWTGCMYCVEHCPQNLPIAEYMTYSNLKYLFDIPKDRYENIKDFNFHWYILIGNAKRKETAKNCTKCGNCEEQCTQHINIIERLEELAKIEAGG